MKLQIVIALVALMLAAPVAAPGADELRIDRWLVLGPAGIMADGSALAGGADAALDFDYLPIARLDPKAGASVQWSAQKQLSWTPGAARFSGRSLPAGGLPGRIPGKPALAPGRSRCRRPVPGPLLSGWRGAGQAARPWQEQLCR